jgi:hypothetical protein
MSDWLATHAGIATAEAGMVRKPLCFQDEVMLKNFCNPPSHVLTRL